MHKRADGAQKRKKFQPVHLSDDLDLGFVRIANSLNHDSLWQDLPDPWLASLPGSITIGFILYYFPGGPFCDMK